MAKSVRGFARLCWVITNTTRSRQTRLSCTSSNFARAGAMAECFTPQQSAREDALGTFYPTLEPVDSSIACSAPLSDYPLFRHSLFVKVVCVDAHVRICAVVPPLCSS